MTEQVGDFSVTGEIKSAGSKVPTILSGAGKPQDLFIDSQFIGQIYVDTVAKTTYIAVDVTSTPMSDWKQTGAGVDPDFETQFDLTDISGSPVPTGFEFDNTLYRAAELFYTLEIFDGAKESGKLMLLYEGSGSSEITQVGIVPDPSALGVVFSVDVSGDKTRLLYANSSGEVMSLKIRPKYMSLTPDSPPVITFEYKAYAPAANLVLGTELVNYSFPQSMVIALVELHDGVPVGFVQPVSNVPAVISVVVGGVASISVPTRSFRASRADGASENIFITTPGAGGLSALHVDIITPVGNFDDGDTQVVNWTP